MIVLPKMGLVKWDSINDAFSHEQLAANFTALDSHDHTPGKGVKIPYGGLDEQSVGRENLREGIIDTTTPAWRIIRFGVGAYGASTSGTKYFINSNSLGDNSGLEPFSVVPGDYAATGYTPKIRIRSTCVTNGTAPAVTFTVGMYPVTAVVAGSCTIGAALAGSTVAFAAPALNTITSSASSEFSVPAEGTYLIGVANSGTSAASSSTAFSYQLQLHYV